MLSQQVKHFKLPKNNPMQFIFKSQTIATLIEPQRFLKKILASCALTVWHRRCTANPLAAKTKK